MDIEFTDGYNSVSDIAEAVVQGCAEAQNCATEDVEIVPITAIDEVEMDRALKNPDEVSQEQWDTLRRRIREEVMTLGPRVD
jgi:hypothetical protein